jgi:hypothetical protein
MRWARAQTVLRASVIAAISRQNASSPAVVTECKGRVVQVSLLDPFDDAERIAAAR